MNFIAVCILLTGITIGMVVANVVMWKKLGAWFDGKDIPQPNLFAFAAARLSIILTANSYILCTTLYMQGRSVHMSRGMAPVHWFMSWRQGAALKLASEVVSLLSPFTVTVALICGIIAILWGRGGRDPRSVKLGGCGVALNSLLIMIGCGMCVYVFIPQPKPVASGEPAEVEPYRYHGEQPKWDKPAEVAAFAARYKERGYTQIVEEKWLQTEPVSDPTIVFASSASVAGEVHSNLVLVAQSVTIRGDIAGDVEFFGQALRIKRDATIDGNLHIHGAQVVRIDGDVTGQITGNYNTLRD